MRKAPRGVQRRVSVVTPAVCVCVSRGGGGRGCTHAAHHHLLGIVVLEGHGILGGGVVLAARKGGVGVGGGEDIVDGCDACSPPKTLRMAKKKDGRVLTSWRYQESSPWSRKRGERHGKAS